MVAVALVRCLTGWSIPGGPHGRQIGQFVVGLGIGMYVDQQVIGQLLAHSLLLVMLVIATLLASFVPITLLRATGENRATAFFSSMPGGSVEMVNLAQRNGARVDSVTMAQTLEVDPGGDLRAGVGRILVPAGNKVIQPLVVNWGWVSLLIPLGLLAGRLWQRIRQPNPWLLGPLLISAGVSLTTHVQVGFPLQINHLAQVVIGISLGSLISRDFFVRGRNFILSTLLGTVCLILVMAVMAVAASWLCPLNVSSLMLGIMPGGIAEMSLTAKGLNLAAPWWLPCS